MKQGDRLWSEEMPEDAGPCRIDEILCCILRPHSYPFTTSQTGSYANESEKETLQSFIGVNNNVILYSIFYGI